MLDMDKKIPVTNICTWDVSFKRLESIGDVIIHPGVTYRQLTRSEVVAQCQTGNRLFVGTDGQGSHARLYIDDKDTRVEVGFESADEKSKQNILTAETVEEMFKMKSAAAFKKRVEQTVQTQAEKALFVDLVKKLGLNDYEKIKFIEELTGLKVN